MSFTDFYFDREEKRIFNQTGELVKNELESKENFADIFAALQEFKNVLERSLEDDEEIAISGDEFIDDAYKMLDKVRKFEEKYENLY